ncbi:MAG: lytic transglycosylase domain-containing protein [Rhodospirillaceae bacterium]|nr:lytic transglycosylase domain-containing protein [Rhodospirillaceae bacterium]
MTRDPHHRLRLPRSLLVVPLLAAAALLPSCAERGGVDPSALGRRDPVEGYGTWKPALDAVPQAIAERDAALYREIYALQNRGDWAGADRLIAQLKDRALLGHVLAARYLGTYTANYAELQNWLKKYGDEPDAGRIRQLASLKHSRPVYHRKRTRHRRADLVPDSTFDASPSATTSRRPKPRPDYRRRGHTRRAHATLQGQYQLELKRGNLERAEAILTSAGAEKSLGATRLDSLKSELAIYFLQAGKFDRAYALASAATRSKDQVPNAPWVAGLAGWKAGKYREAAQYFEAVADARRGNEWSEARAAYWAARAYDSAGDEAGMRRSLARAAARPRTLYGMLARQRLGQRQEFDFGVAMQAVDRDLADIGASPEGKRAFGLIQIGMRHGAGEELLRRYRANGERQSETYLAIADRGGLPDLAYYVSAQVFTRTGRTYDPGLYPVPQWTPRDGFQLDRALIFGIMRQESAFQAKVVSRANARGLMQLIPPTASSMAGDRNLRNQLGRLYDPEFNMELGQRYLRQLLQSADISGNVALTAAAYNAGEGAVMKWTAREDALLFMATIPYTETREYVERVLYNISAYRLRFGQRPAELEDLAQNRWPIYRAQDR